MITMVEIVEGYETYWECWASDDKYLGEVYMDEVELYIKGITDNGGSVEIVRGV